MQKSLYQDKTFADYWNERAGDAGEVYKHYVLDPLMFKLVGDFKNKVVVELGCGNGYLAAKFIKQSPQRAIMMDISEYNLQHAAKKCQDSRVEFLQQDATKPWKIDTKMVDVVYPNMMLNEVEDSGTPIREAARVLKKDGVFVFSVTHPAWDLFIYAQEKAGKHSDKIKGLGNYFHRGMTYFMMGSQSVTNTTLHKQYGRDFAVEHYQRPIADYFSQLTGAGFSVDQLLEPELTDELLKQAPRFTAYADHPVGLVFYCTKLT